MVSSLFSVFHTDTTNLLHNLGSSLCAMWKAFFNTSNSHCRLESSSLTTPNSLGSEGSYGWWLPNFKSIFCCITIGRGWPLLCVAFLRKALFSSFPPEVCAFRSEFTGCTDVLPMVHSTLFEWAIWRTTRSVEGASPWPGCYSTQRGVHTLLEDFVGPIV